MKQRLIFPVRCAICRYNVCSDELPICSDCVHILQTIITTPCINCGKAPSACTCPNIDRLRFLMFFRGMTAHRVIYRLKYRGDRRALAFFAELALYASGIDINSVDGIAFVPRINKNRLLYGYDQSRLMAKSLSKRYGIPLVDIIKRVGGTDQKLLSRAERIKNIKSSIRISRIPEKKYKKLLLIDDIYTTGASVSACAELLRRDAAEAVVPLVLTKSNTRKTILR